MIARRIEHRLLFQSLTLTLAVAMSVQACAPSPDVAGEASARELSVSQRIKALGKCDRFADLDLKAIIAVEDERTPANMERSANGHVTVRGPEFEFQRPEGAEIILSMVMGSGETQSVPTSTSSYVWRVPGGPWLFDRVDDRVGIQPRRKRSSGELNPELAASIDEALADPCFQLQPSLMPINLPVMPGKVPRGPCYGVLYNSLLIEWGDGRSRMVSEFCGGFYADKLNYAVIYAR